jgi:hypothetical protein
MSESEPKRGARSSPRARWVSASCWRGSCASSASMSNASIRPALRLRGGWPTAIAPVFFRAPPAASWSRSRAATLAPAMRSTRSYAGYRGSSISPPMARSPSTSSGRRRPGCRHTTSRRSAPRMRSSTGCRSSRGGGHPSSSRIRISGSVCVLHARPRRLPST